MKKIIIAVCSIIFIAIGLFTFSLCFTKIDPNEKVGRENIVIGVEAIPADLTLTSDKTADNILSALFGGIVKKDEDGNIIASLCDNYEVSEDGLEYRFKFNEDLKWSNGDRMLPREICLFLSSVIKDKDSEGSKLLSSIYGYTDYIESKDISKLALEYTKDEIKIRLNNKNDKFLENLCSPKLRVCKDYSLNKDIKTNYNKIVSSGPYYIKSANEAEIKLAVNKNYNESDKLVKEVKIVKGDSQELVFAYYKTNNLDICFNPPLKGVKELSEENVKVLNENNLKYLAISSDLNSELRKGIYNCVSAEILEYNNSNENKFRAFDENLSGKVLSKENEWVKPTFNDSSESKILTLLCEDNDENRELVSFLQDKIKEDLGVLVKCTLANKENMEEKLNENNYDLVIDNCKYENREKIELANKLSNNHLLLNNEKKDKSYDEYKKSIGDEKRKEKASEFIAYLDEANMVIPLYYSKEILLIDNKVNSLRIDSYGNIEFESLINNK